MQSTEYEVSFKIPVPRNSFSFGECMQKIFEVDGNKTTRVLKTSNRIRYQEKICTYSYTTVVLFKGFVLQLKTSYARETDLNFLSLDNPTVLERRFTFDNVGIRWAIENDTTLHVECEFPSEDECTIDNFLHRLESSCFLNQFTSLESQTTSLMLINLPDINVARKFSTNCTKLTKFTHKLDGIRRVGILHGTNAIIPEIGYKLQLDRAVNNLQIFTFAVEDIDGVIVLIDVCQVYSYDGVYMFDIPPLLALDILKMIPMLKNESFNHPPIKECPFPTDGYLGYNSFEIEKFKTVDTIDLVYYPRRREGRKLAHSGFFFRGDLAFSDHSSFELVCNQDLSTHCSPIVQFLIVEFEIDYEKKKVFFKKIRKDKCTANLPIN